MKTPRVHTLVAAAAAFLLTACTTIIINFPAVEVRNAAEDYTRDVYRESGAAEGEEGTDGTPGTEGSGGADGNAALDPFHAPPVRRGPVLALARTAFAQDGGTPDITLETPAILEIKKRQVQRMKLLKVHFEAERLGVDREGMVTVRNTEGLGLRDRQGLKKQVDAENHDRSALYAEVARANRFAEERIPDIRRAFAAEWRDEAPEGWWIQHDSGKWVRRGSEEDLEERRKAAGGR